MTPGSNPLRHITRVPGPDIGNFGPDGAHDSGPSEVGDKPKRDPPPFTVEIGLILLRTLRCGLAILKDPRHRRVPPRRQPLHAPPPALLIPSAGGPGRQPAYSYLPQPLVMPFSNICPLTP